MPTFEFSDDHYRALSDLLLGIRDARLAWQAAKGKVEEWDSFASEIRRGERAGAPLHTLIDEAASWASGWWRRANARLSARPSLRSNTLVSSDRLYKHRGGNPNLSSDTTGSPATLPDLGITRDQCASVRATMSHAIVSDS